MIYSHLILWNLVFKKIGIIIQVSKDFKEIHLNPNSKEVGEVDLVFNNQKINFFGIQIIISFSPKMIYHQINNFQSKKEEILKY